MRFIVNSESSVIHLFPAREEDNLDSADKKRLKEVGWREFIMLIQEGMKPCVHCFELDEAE